MKNIRHAIYFGIAGIIISGCNGRIPFVPKIIDPGSKIGTKCDYKTPGDAPSVMYEVSQLVPFNARIPKFSVIEYTIDKDGNKTSPGGNPASAVLGDVLSNRLNMNANLNSDPKKGRFRIRLKFILLNNPPIVTDPSDLAPKDNIGFHKSENNSYDLAITSVDDNRDMFCYVSWEEKTAIIDAVYFDKNPKVKRPNHASFNINIDVPEDGGTGYMLPISLDPEVRNHG